MKQKVAEFLNAIFGFRKFLALILIYIVGIAFRINNLINGAELVDLFKSVTLAFFGANGIEHVIGAIKGKTAPKDQGDDPNTSYEDLISKSAQESEDVKGEKNG